MSKEIEMSSSLNKLKALTSRLENKIEEKKKNSNISIKSKVVSNDINFKYPTIKEVNRDIQKENMARIAELYNELKIFEKSPDFNKIFLYKAMNLSGIGLKNEDFGETREGKYIQIIAITYEADKAGKKKAKNISLGYFGKAETINHQLKKNIIEFVLRWRYEKAFQNLQHYKELIDKTEILVDPTCL